MELDGQGEGEDLGVDEGRKIMTGIYCIAYGSRGKVSHDDSNIEQTGWHKNYGKSETCYQMCRNMGILDT